MLYRKHLHPWLIVDLIACVVLLLLDVAVVVMVSLNQINGLKFGGYALTGCGVYVNMKLDWAGEMRQLIDFFFSILAGALALVQLVIIVWQYYSYKQFKDKVDDWKVGYEQLTLKKLIVFYMLNVCGILCLVVPFGSLLSFWVELGTCQQLEDYSWRYFIPWILAAVALVVQVFVWIVTLKLFYHSRQQQINQQIARQQALHRQQREKIEMHNVKRRISQSGRRLEREQSPSKNMFYSQSTDQDSPRDIDAGLLDKMREDYYNGREGSIYGNDDTGRGDMQFDYSQMSPSTISAKQKEVMKTLPRHPYKNTNSKFGPKDVIFEENSEDDPQLDGNGKPNDPNMSLETQRPLETSKNQPTPIKPSDHTPIGQLFRQKYQNSPYLKFLDDKNVTAEERRNIKRPYLKLSKKMVLFDAKNYSNEMITNSLFDFAMSKIKKPGKDDNPYNKIGGSLPPKGKQKDSKNDSKSSSKNPVSTSRKKVHPSYYHEKSMIEGRKIQDQNPIYNYVDEDDIYDDKLNKILEFEKISRRRRRTFATLPFYNHYLDEKEDPGKLYLHKNKNDGPNMKNNLDDNEENEGYDPFRDEAYDDELMTRRGLMEDDLMDSSTGKGSYKVDLKKNNSKELQSPSQTKKSNRRDVFLLDFIRSKHVID